MQIDQFKHEENWQQDHGKISGFCLETETDLVRTFTNPAHEILLALEGFKILGKCTYGAA